MTSTIEAIYTIWLREITRFLKSKSRMVGSGGQPFIWLAIFGVGLSSAFSVISGVSYLAFMVPGIMGMTLLFSSVFAGVSVIWDRQFGFLKEILVAPVSRVGIVLGKIAGSTTVAMVTALSILVVVVIFGVIPIGSLTVIGVLEAIFFMLLTSATFVAIGLIIASYVNNMEGFQVLVNFLIFPLFFLSGAIFPLTDAPIWLKALSTIDPLTYAVDGMRGALINVSTHSLGVDAIIVLVVAVAFVLIADNAFKRIQGR
jgi:ABC-2 type transport system permease protein